VPKRTCTNRAEWRLLRGKPAQHLSAHYQLDCDYGTPLITVYTQGEGDNPIFLCETHAKAMGRSEAASVAGVRPIEAPTANGNDPTPHDTRTQPLEPAAAKHVAPTPAAGGNSPAPLDTRTAPIELTEAKPVAATPAADGNIPAPLDTRTAPIELTEAKPVAPAPSPAVASPTVAKVAREKTDAPAKSVVRDLTYGNSTKALVDETIWNMAAGDYEAYRIALRQGKSATDAALAAGGQLAVVHRKIGEYTLKIEAVLSESKATIDAGDAIDNPLERATLEIIGNNSMADAEKDAAIAHLGALQESIKHGLNRQMTPLQAHHIARAIGDRANWGATSQLSEQLKPAYRAVYASLRNAIRAAVPDARDLEERLANLQAAKAELESAPAAKIAPDAAVNITGNGGAPAANAESTQVRKTTLREPPPAQNLSQSAR
jgi:hypothetical protein